MVGVIKMNLEPCDIIFVKKRRNATWFDKIIEKGIKWATGSQYFHVAYFVEENTLFEANGNRVAGYASLEDYEEYDVKRLKLPIEIRQKVLNHIVKTEGMKYNYLEIVSLFLRKKCGVHIYYDKIKYYICSSELFDAVEKETGIRLLDQVTSDVSPEDLWESPFLEEIK
jgi:hypothetical protein